MKNKNSFTPNPFPSDKWDLSKCTNFTFNDTEPQETDLEAADKILVESYIKTDSLVDSLTRDGFVTTSIKANNKEEKHETFLRKI